MFLLYIVDMIVVSLGGEARPIEAHDLHLRNHCGCSLVV